MRLTAPALEPVIPSGCLPPDGMGSRANRVEEDLDQRKLRELRKPRMACSRSGGRLQKMQKMQKIQKQCAFNGLAGIGQPAGNWQKMQKFTSEATAVHAPRLGRKAAARRRKRHSAVKTTVTCYWSRY